MGGNEGSRVYVTCPGIMASQTQPRLVPEGPDRDMLVLLGLRFSEYPLESLLFLP